MNFLLAFSLIFLCSWLLLVCVGVGQQEGDTEIQKSSKSCWDRGNSVSCCPQVGWALPCVQLDAQGLQVICWCCPALSLQGWRSCLWEHSASHPKFCPDIALGIPHGASNARRVGMVMQGCVGRIVSDATRWALTSPYHLWSHIPAMPRKSGRGEKAAGRSHRIVPGTRCGLWFLGASALCSPNCGSSWWSQ